ncbi:alpha/beta hydrolase family protein [Streptomyces decoyicus]|uniref:alpha/beta hydrolase n=1 Tax=Streptomyces decoyicus TaxID=249567 RepID=UPI002E1913AA
MSNEFRLLLKLDVSDLETAAAAWKKLSEQLDHSRTAHRRRVTGPLHASDWKGRSADAALASLEEKESQLGRAVEQTMLLHTVLTTAETELTAARTALRHAVRDAEDDGFDVTDDGTINPPPGGPSNYGGPLNEHRDRMERALQRAREASARAVTDLGLLESSVLTSRLGWQNASGDAKQIASHAKLYVGDMPLDKSPQQNAAWWRSLDEDEQRVYLAAYPELVGQMDGLPTTVRDEANRTVLEKHLEYVRGPEAIREMHGPKYLKYRKSLEDLNSRLDEADGAPQHKQLYVLGLDPEDGLGDGKAIIAMGNPDKAKHTAVLVPGTNADLSGTDGQINRIDKLQESAMGTSTSGAEGEVATITWLGYDAPEFPDGSGVDDTDRAEAGADDLRRFVQGTRAAHQGDEPSHLTVIGHSYGSTTVGAAAAQDGGLGADDIVAVGSPGMTVDRAEDLHMDPKHVYVGASHDDPIVKHFANLTLGPNPADREFGATPMPVNDHGDHSSYWDNDGLESQGRIIAGETPDRGSYYNDGVNPVAPDGTNPLVIG